MEPSAVFEQAEGLLSAPVDDEIVFLNPMTDNYVAFDAVGRCIWELLETPRSVDDLVDALTEEFDGSREEISADVQGFLDELAEEKMVRVLGSSPQ